MCGVAGRVQPCTKGSTLERISLRIATHSSELAEGDGGSEELAAPAAPEEAVGAEDEAGVEVAAGAVGGEEATVFAAGEAAAEAGVVPAASDLGMMAAISLSERGLKPGMLRANSS